jgi:hypothetical protein
MVKLFDGYFPMRVHQTINYPTELLDYESVDPPSSPGVLVDVTPGKVEYEVVFEGVLWIETRFRVKGSEG